jgi:hypothetical protein
VSRQGVVGSCTAHPTAVPLHYQRYRVAKKARQEPRPSDKLFSHSPYRFSHHGGLSPGAAFDPRRSTPFRHAQAADPGAGPPGWRMQVDERVR